MDLGLVVHYYDRGEGTGGYVVELVNRFAARHQVTVYAAGVRTAPPDGVRVVKVPALKGRAYATVLSFPWAFQTVKRRHDILHVQGWNAFRADVVTTHIVLGAWRAAASRAGIRPPLGERLFGAMVARAERGLVGRATRVIAPSRRASADIERCYGRTDGVTVVHHGFPAAGELPDRAAARRRFGIPANAFVALYAGDARKGLEPAVRAAVATPGAHLLIASHSFRGSYSGGERIHWPGPMADIREAFAAADVLLHPTIYDTFALVVAEAMAWGVPAIVSPEAGVVELVEHRRTAWVIQPDGSDATTALATLRDDPGLRSRIGLAARDVARSRSWDRVADETLAVYDAARRR